MLKRNNDGFYYVSDNTGKMYDLDMGVTIGLHPSKKSDRCFIVSTDLTEDEYEIWKMGTGDKEIKEEIVGWFYGATFLEDDKYKDDFINTIKEFVEEYESQITSIFSKVGIQGFYNAIEESSYNEVLYNMQHGRKPNEDKIAIKIKVGNQDIVVPYTDNNYCRLYDFLMECREDTIDIKRETEEDGGKKMAESKQNYIVKNVINDSCYASVFLDVISLVAEEGTDGWYSLNFLSWLYQESKDFDDYQVAAKPARDIYFAIYNKEDVGGSNIKYGTTFKDCLVQEENLSFQKYFRIHMTEDCSLEEIVPRVKSIDEQILETLLAYQITNKEVLSKLDNKDLQDQIDYMKKKVEES